MCARAIAIHGAEQKRESRQQHDVFPHNGVPRVIAKNRRFRASVSPGSEISHALRKAKNSL
jgi:hypothetical protein